MGFADPKVLDPSLDPRFPLPSSFPFSFPIPKDLDPTRSGIPTVGMGFPWAGIPGFLSPLPQNSQSNLPRADPTWKTGMNPSTIHHSQIPSAAFPALFLYPKEFLAAPAGWEPQEQNLQGNVALEWPLKTKSRNIGNISKGHIPKN